MRTKAAISSRLLGMLCLAGLAFSTADIAHADTAASADASDSIGELAQLREQARQSEARLKRDEAILEAQAKELSEQRQMLADQQRELASMRMNLASALDGVRATGYPGAVDNGPHTIVLADNSPSSGSSTTASGAASSAATTTSGTPSVSGTSDTPTKPVGDAPPPAPEPKISLPQGIYVLTAPHHLVFDNGIEYQNASSNRLVFEGVEIAGALLIGVLQANTTANNSVIASSSIRYGLGHHFEIEGDIPYVYRNDRVTTVATAGNDSLTQSYYLKGHGLGDLEMTGRYQLTSGRPGMPILVANLRVKSDTGTGPYAVKFDALGSALTLPVGSGFWAIQPSLSWVYPSDPVVLFGNIGYMHSFARNINKQIGQTFVGRVEPGDSISVSTGFAFSLNQKFSYSLGYRDNVFLRTTTHLNNLIAKSTTIQSGSLLMGASYRLTNRLSLNLNFEFGVTADAPSDTIVLRLPYYF